MPANDSATQTLLEAAMADYLVGHLAKAESALHDLLKVDPQQFDALRLLGLLKHQQGANEEAASLLERAIEARPDIPEAFNELGAVQQSRSNSEAALSCFERAIALHPQFYEARSNLACLLALQRKFDRAKAQFEILASLYPDRPEVYANLGAVVQDQGDVPAAIELYRKALSLKPDLVEAHSNLAQALEKQGNLPSAIEEARAVVRLSPENWRAWTRLGGLLNADGRRSEAQQCFRTVMTSKPDFVEARWMSTMAELPIAYGLQDNPNDCRQAFDLSLSELERWFDETPRSDDFLAVSSMQPFALAYQECDNRPLLSRYGALCSRLMQQWFDREHLSSPIVHRTGKVRVGIVSGMIYDQSVWIAIVKGWCKYLDRQRFELHFFYTGTVVDGETELAKSLAAQFTTGLNLRQWTKEILDRELDVLLYPEIGMDGMSLRLASLRLAPVQAAMWGHPETTGLPTIDYYLSSEDFEPAEAQRWYSERLALLPGMGCIYAPHKVDFDASAVDRLGLDRSRVLLLCPGTPYKYLPKHDAIFVEIARRAPECCLIFCHDIRPDVSALVQARLQAAFADAGLRFEDHGLFIPHQPRAAFFGLMQAVDLCLDTIGFSGFNTTMQAVECGLPVIGYEGRFMRGRFASGILKRMGLAELVAATDEQYVELVTKVSRDVAYLQRIRGRIADGAPTLFGDLSPLPVFEEFLESTARKARQSHFPRPK